MGTDDRSSRRATTENENCVGNLEERAGLSDVVRCGKRKRCEDHGDRKRRRKKVVAFALRSNQVFFFEEEEDDDRDDEENLTQAQAGFSFLPQAKPARGIMKGP